MTTTPVFTAHARRRCREMGITTKRVKRLFRLATVDYPGPARHGENRVRYGDADPELALAYRPGDPPTILTVLWHRNLGVWSRKQQPKRKVSA